MDNRPTNDHLKAQEKRRRADDFAAKLAATGMKKSDFANEAGFSRNVIYNLSIGQAPSSPEQARRLAEAFDRLKRR
jgi:plasmid maintenance system antidote protein VapI